MLQLDTRTIEYHLVQVCLYAARTAGKWPKYTTGELSNVPEVRYSVRRGRIVMVQTYEFDHTGQGPCKTVV